MHTAGRRFGFLSPQIMGTYKMSLDEGYRPAASLVRVDE